MRREDLRNVSEPQGYLAVTIDTEEEGLWSGNYSSTATVENIACVPKFQEVCDRFEVRPTYLITTPVAQSHDAVAVLKSIQDDGRCEIGTHVHPWNSPPLGHGSDRRRNSFLCNLPADQQLAKIETLTKLIEERFGRRPLSFRAGRYGMGSEGIQILRDLGYRVDSSVIPYTDYSSSDGPDFSAADCMPYFPGRRSIRERGGPGDLLEVPVSVGFTHGRFEFANRLRDAASCTPWRQLKAVGVLDRIGIATKIKLSPEQATLEQMKKLARAILYRGTRSLVLMFHSSSLKPGCSPYVDDEEALTRFLCQLGDFFRFCTEEIDVKPLPLEGLADLSDQLVGRVA